MNHMQRTIIAQQLFGLRSGRTMWQFGARNICQTLEVIVTCVAKMRRAKAKEDGHRTAISTLVLQEIGAMFGAHLRTSHIRAAAANQFLGVEFIAGLRITTCLAAVVGFFAFKADVVGVPVHRVGRRITCRRR